MTNDPLPQPGPAFRVGDEVAFFPAVVSVPDDPGWLRWDYAVIDDVREAAESVGFHFVSEPGVRHAQGMENIVRRTEAYARWRSAYEAALAAGADADGDPLIEALRTRVLAEHPIHGGGTSPHPAVAAARSRDIRER
jgi:hypothetical protein